MDYQRHQKKFGIFIVLYISKVSLCNVISKSFYLKMTLYIFMIKFGLQKVSVQHSTKKHFTFVLSYSVSEKKDTEYFRKYFKLEIAEISVIADIF